MTAPEPAPDLTLPPILWWSPSLAVGDGLDWEPGVAAGVVVEVASGRARLLLASHEGGWAALRDLPADARRLVVEQTAPEPEPDIGVVLRELAADLEEIRAQARQDGETHRAVGIGDALDLLRSRIAHHPRRSAGDTTTNQPKEGDHG